jgi:hypothetical protein
MGSFSGAGGRFGALMALQASPRSAKRVLRSLTNEDREREALGWTDTQLDVLHARGEHNGLRDFLCEIRKRLLPKLGPRD